MENNSGSAQVVKAVLSDLWENHRGKLMGVIIGVVFAMLVLTLGFWRSLFITICVLVGFLIGKRVDEQGSWRELYDRLFRKS